MPEEKPELKPLTNVWTIYHSDTEEPHYAELRRPKDWGDPKWMYRVYTLEALGYRNTVHCWYDRQVSEAKHLEMFCTLITSVTLPGADPRRAGCEFLHEDDFWDRAWGTMPPHLPDDADHDDLFDWFDEGPDHEPDTSELDAALEMITNAPIVVHPKSKILNCPNCGEPMMFKGVMLTGNILMTGQANHPEGRWDCIACKTIVADPDIDEGWGWQQWERQKAADRK